MHLTGAIPLLEARDGDFPHRPVLNKGQGKRSFFG